MNIEDAIKQVNKTFKYRPDTGRIDSWKIMQEPYIGDCEDYSLTVLYLTCDKSLLKLLFTLATFKYIMWYVIAPSGEGHVVTQVGDKYFDNIQRKLVLKNKLIADGYTGFSIRLFPIVFTKMLLSKLFT